MPLEKKKFSQISHQIESHGIILMLQYFGKLDIKRGPLWTPLYPADLLEKKHLLSFKNPPA